MGTSTTIEAVSQLNSSAYERVQERIMRQTLEALWFEGILPYERGEGDIWQTEGRNAAGQAVMYSCRAAAKLSFGRIRIEPGTIQREGQRCVDVHLFLHELVSERLEGERIQPFIQELLETLAKDSQCQAALHDQIPAQDKHYDALESYMTDGHPYHPSYKSRLGFSLRDNAAYAPEFNPEVRLYWVAVHQDWADTAVSAQFDAQALYAQHLTASDRQRFTAQIAVHGDPQQYTLLPVHPWQWEHRIEPAFTRQRFDGILIPLGAAEATYRPQQSIRSLSSRVTAEAPYVKLALHMTNTSTSRILAHHTTQNAPLISDWLHGLIQQDTLLQEQGFAILREMIGVSFRYAELPTLQYGEAYGSLGTIWRENITGKLSAQEQAWPLNAVSLIQPNGQPFAAEAIARHGVEAWSKALIRAVVLPIVHLLYAHGIALESHAQNIILVLENELPKRIIVKDLHDGVRYVPEQLLYPEQAPKLHPIPETHRKFNRYSFIHAETVAEVRDYTYDAFFFICMTDLAFTLERFGLPEAAFWKLCADTITNYQRQHPQYAARYDDYDLFAPDALIEEMTKRRLYGDSELYFRSVSNPLQLARDGHFQ
ncbi:IucA/IucC family protein [Paenibacillus campi]|uniref:IucA/IucC family protein n=1 Tax=Paenibacillus campi TaxID=3106031 RepID=UPI002AFEA970|nr:IucA/IucC family protein [Paenibacillus sp. SGZ-1014]